MQTLTNEVNGDPRSDINPMTSICMYQLPLAVSRVLIFGVRCREWVVGTLYQIFQEIKELLDMLGRENRCTYICRIYMYISQRVLLCDGEIEMQLILVQQTTENYANTGMQYLLLGT